MAIVCWAPVAAAIVGELQYHVGIAAGSDQIDIAIAVNVGRGRERGQQVDRVFGTEITGAVILEPFNIGL
ncbi:MAG: hypothetical protein R2818_14550 [Flavobacteriales bacterium]